MATNTTNFNWFVPTIGGDGDLWGDYWNSNINSQDSLIRRQMNNFINSTAPSEAQNGTFWVNNTTNPWVLSIFDGTDWISIGTINTTTNTFNVSSTSNYVGDIKNSVQSANHGSWLLCNGNSISTSTYSGLFALIGYSFGGSGASFNLPDMRGRVAGAIGSGSGLTTRTLGETSGSETNTISQANIPDYLIQGSVCVGNNDGSNIRASLSGSGNSYYDVRSGGSGTAMNNMQPTLFTGNYFIFSGV